MHSRSCPMARGPWSAAIAGGFVRVEVSPLLRAWRACHGHPGGGTDFRIWLALREVRVRRAAARVDVPTLGPRWRAELAQLCDLGGRRVAQGVRRLVGWGLIADSEGATIPGDLDPMLSDDNKDAPGWVDDSLPRRRGILAIPRRILRFLARCGRPPAIALALGALLRCLSRRKSGWGSRGRLKTGWVAAVFGVDARRVKEARADLLALGWLGTEGDARDQPAWNRWGRVHRIDLAWSDPGAKPHPKPAAQGAGSPPLDLHPAPLPGEKNNPEPGHGRVAAPDPGDRLRRGIALVPDTQSNLNHPRPGATTSPAPVSRPDLRAITGPDLRDVRRTLILHAQAVAAGWIGASEADRLRFVAAAVHAEGIATINPPGLFRALVVGRCWRRLTQRDEDEARRRLRAPHQPQAPPPSTSRSSACVAQASPRPLNALSALASRLGLGTEPYGPPDGI